MSSGNRKYKVDIPDDLKKTTLISFKAAPRTLEKVAAYAKENEMTLADACRQALDKLVESTPVTSN